jgi:beta-lactamase regulating signal transducer with metallopeptidase domain
MPFVLLNPDTLQAAIPPFISDLAVMFSAFAQAAAPAAAAALWQGAVVALLLALCLRLTPRVSATYRFAVWAAGFVTVAVLPLIPFLMRLTAATGVSPAAHLVAPAAAPWLELDSRWAIVIAALWIALSAARAVSLGMHSFRLRRLWKSASPIEGASLPAQLTVPLRMRSHIEICTTQALDRPGVIGFLAPRILIPDWLYVRLSPAELEHTILHEAEHLRRRDDWTNLLQKLCMILFPLNPALVWMEQRLAKEREMACDEAVVRRTCAPRAYAACLTNLAEQSRERRGLLRRAEALSLSAFERRSELVRRVHSILWNRQSLHPLVARALVTVVSFGLLVALTVSTKCPQMVAFVTAPQAIEHATVQANPPSAQASLVRASANAHSSSAALPKHIGSNTPIATALPHGTAKQSDDLAAREVVFNETDSSEAYKTLLKAVAPAHGATPVQEQSFIVLAAWEQVQSASLQPRQFADYDLVEPAQKQTANIANRTSRQTPVQITITRLILEVYPAGSTSVSGSHAPVSDSQQVPASKSNQPARLPFDSSWLIFQL